jgi:hypothetical protein
MDEANGRYGPAARVCEGVEQWWSRKNGETMAQVEFHFDFGSPNAYLAHLVIPEIEQRTGAKFEYVPVLLGGVYKLTGNRSPDGSFRFLFDRLR